MGKEDLSPANTPKKAPATQRKKRKYTKSTSAKDLTEAQRTLMIQKLSFNDWDVTKTAKEFNMTRRQMDYIVRKHGLRTYTNNGEMARLAKDIVVKHMEEFMDLADGARIEAVERLRDLIPKITDVRQLLGIIEELTKYIDGGKQEGENGIQAGGLLRDLQHVYNTQININNKENGKETDIAGGDE